MTLPEASPERPYPCQGSAPDCSWWCAEPFGRCPECSTAMRQPRRSSVAEALRAGPRLDPLPLPATVVPPRADWLEVTCD